MSQLRITSTILNGGVFELAGDYFTIGREPDNTIQIDHISISKHHAMLKIDGGDFQLFDLHSTNGVLVNGEPRIVAHLREGDRIVASRVVVKAAPPVIEERPRRMTHEEKERLDGRGIVLFSAGPNSFSYCQYEWVSIFPRDIAIRYSP